VFISGLFIWVFVPNAFFNGAIMKYNELKTRHEAEFSKFPIFFAFNGKQFDEGMRKLGLSDVKDVLKICAGGFIRKTDAQALKELIERHQEEMDKHLRDREFLMDAIIYEFENHEFGCTWDYKPVVDVLGLSPEENPVHKECLKEAVSIFRSAMD